jgi:hypothetical protein
MNRWVDLTRLMFEPISSCKPVVSKFVSAGYKRVFVGKTAALI